MLTFCSLVLLSPDSVVLCWGDFYFIFPVVAVTGHIVLIILFINHDEHILQPFNPLSAGPEISRVKKNNVPLSQVSIYLGTECFFLVFLSVKSMWSGNHRVYLVLADKSVFFWLFVDVYPPPIIICGPIQSCHSKMILLERKMQNAIKSIQ